MTTFTLNELATRVLRDLGLVGAEETPTAADQSWAEQTISSEILLLGKKDIPIWNGGVSSIPEEYLTLLSRRLGLALGPSFGLMDIATATMAMKVAEADLRAIGSVGPTGTAMVAEFF